MSQFIRHLNDKDIADVFSIFKRVGRNQFTYPEISDILPNPMRLRVFNGCKVMAIEKRRHHSSPTIWRFRDEMASRIETAMKTGRGEKYYADISL